MENDAWTEGGHGDLVRSLSSPLFFLVVGQREGFLIKIFFFSCRFSVYRLALEWARLVADDREARTYK